MNTKTNKNEKLKISIEENTKINKKTILKTQSSKYLYKQEMINRNNCQNFNN